MARNYTGKLPITRDGMVVIRGIPFPVDNILAAMRETGGIVVSDERINSLLDKKMAPGVTAILIENFLDYYFIPWQIRLHSPLNPSGELLPKYLYFAVKKK